MSKKRLLINLLLCQAIAVSLISSTLINNQKDESLICESSLNNNIKVKSIKYTNDNNYYGIETISYTVNPKINTDEVLYSLKYENGDDIEDNIFDITFKPEDCRLTLKCINPFTKTIVLTLFAESNKNINASINIDFKEKISTNPHLNIDESSPLSIDINLSTTGGSITVDKSIKNEQLSFSNTFIETVKAKLKERFKKVYYTNYITTTYTETSAGFHGLEQRDCDHWFNNPFTYTEFLNSIYYDVEYTWIESDSDYETYEHDIMYTYELLEEDFFTIFDGNTPIFEYTYTINDLLYRNEFGIEITDINIANISIVSKDIVF